MSYKIRMLFGAAEQVKLSMVNILLSRPKLLLTIMDGMGCL